MKKVSIAETFAINTRKEAMVEAFEDATHPRIPKAIPHYQFKKEMLGAVLAFLAAPYGSGLYLTGPTGCGKTSVIGQIAARLNWPVQEMTCRGRFEFAELTGHHTIVDGSMKFVHGPLAVAVRDGHIMMLNEIDVAEPSELAGLNGVLDGMPLVIPENEGEVIIPHEKFRLVATGNSVGQGDDTGLYQGVLRQNLALLDRFRVLEVNYPDAESERDILGKVAPYLSRQIIEGMIKTAAEIRKMFSGDGPQQVTVTLSTRGLVQWALLSGSYKGAPNPLRMAFEQVILNKADRSQREGLDQAARLIFGDEWK
ncbi:MAG: AAA family ATPase [Acidiferrobacter sp.]